MKKRIYPCIFPIYLNDGLVVRCLHCHNCKKYVIYLKKEIKKENKHKSNPDLHFKKLEDYIK